MIPLTSLVLWGGSLATKPRLGYRKKVFKGPTRYLVRREKGKKHSYRVEMPRVGGGES